MGKHKMGPGGKVVTHREQRQSNWEGCMRNRDCGNNRACQRGRWPKGEGHLNMEISEQSVTP